jgi:hypothetical protein
MNAQPVSTLERWIGYWNRKVKGFSIWDLKLAQIWTAAWILIFVKLFPQITQLSIWWFVLIMLLCAPRLFCVLFKKNG